MKLKSEIKRMAEGAKAASRNLAVLRRDIKDFALREMAQSLIKARPFIIKENEKDMKNAKKLRLPSAFMDRLKVSNAAIDAMAASIEAVAMLDDPTGSVEKLVKRPNGLLIGKMRVPLGVIGVIYESRPNVTADCISLCLKSGNSLILRGGSEAINSNIAIFDTLNKAALRAGLSQNSFNLIKVIDRSAVSALLGMSDLVDVIIPRGGESLIKEITQKSKIPVIKHYKGVCHVYVDEYADLNMAESISYNAKVQRPGVCNAMETLLVHEDVAARFLPSIAKKFQEAGVKIIGCPVTAKILQKMKIRIARESDWYTEYLDLMLSVKVVKSLEEAISHVAKYGTSHSDAIVTENYDAAMEFLARVDSSAVYVNASTRFTDGFEFGKGAEMGISTDKLHARGPVGLEELTTYKYVVFGNGQIRT